MKARIEWRPLAFNEMNAIITAEPHRAAEFAQLLKWMTRALRTSATALGESRGPHRRVEFFGPLTVLFQPVPIDNVVYVTSVRLRDDYQRR